MATPLKIAVIGDPWACTQFGSTATAQKQFDDRSRAYTDEEHRTALEFHNGSASSMDTVLVNRIHGRYADVCAWYWWPSIERNRDQDDAGSTH